MSEQKYIRVQETAERFKTDESVHPLTKMVAELAIATLESAPTYTPADILAGMWKSVENDLPDNRRNVLVTAFWHEAWQTMEGWYAKESGWHISTGLGSRELPVIAWMDKPLPASPKE